MKTRKSYQRKNRFIVNDYGFTDGLYLEEYKDVISYIKKDGTKETRMNGKWAHFKVLKRNIRKFTKDGSWRRVTKEELALII